MKKISRKAKVLRNLLLILLVFGVAQFFSGLPYPVTELQFRIEERGKLIGPSEILGIEEIDFSWCDRMVIAETEQGVILWISGQDFGRSSLVYREKGEESLLVAPAGSLGYMTVADEIQLPLVLFDRQPRAARAEIRFSLSEIINGELFEKTYELSSRREAQGYFLFTQNGGESVPGWTEEGLTLQVFANYASGQERNHEYHVPIRVCYYDSRDALIAEEHIAVTGMPGDREGVR